MNLELQQLDCIEAPMSDAFWNGVMIGVGIVAAGATIVGTAVVLT